MRRAPLLAARMTMTAAAFFVAASALAAEEGEPQAAPETPAPAPSASPSSTLGDDEVVLKNGGMVRGTIVSVEPGEEVVVSVAGKPEPRVIPWSEVADVQRGKYAERPAPEAAPAPAPVPGYDAPEEPEDDEPPRKPGSTVRLHVVSDKPVEVWQQFGGSVGYMSTGGALVVTHNRALCTSPCDEELPAGGGYFFMGEGMPASGMFSLAGRSGDVTAYVDPGSSGMRGGGWALISVGAAGLAVGAVFTAMGYMDVGGDSLFESGQVAGPAMLGGGAAVLAGGIALMVLSRTTFELEDSAPQTAKNEIAPRWWLGEF